MQMKSAASWAHRIYGACTSREELEAEVAKCMDAAVRWAAEQQRESDAKVCMRMGDVSRNALVQLPKEGEK